MEKFRVFQIDAWADPEGGWTYNDRYECFDFESTFDDVEENFEKALLSWDYAQLLWSLKIGKKDNPVEPDINHFKELMEYGGEFLRTDIHPSNYIVKDYRGKTFLPFDENISILFTVASEQFEKAQPDLLEVIQQ